MLNTSHKILLARALCKSIMSVRNLFRLPAVVTRSRGGISWSLDLKEGIDLAIYALGGFEVRTLNMYKKIIAEGDVILDIGANIGAHTLPLSKLVGDNGRVIAFEPTQFAFAKLNKNIALNPTLLSRITPCQIMLASHQLQELPSEIYSSWPLENSADLHKDHKGRLKSTQGATITSLDQYVKSTNLQRINFIKLDVDGNEYDVLISGHATLKQFKPKLMMELAPFVYDACPEKFDGSLQLLWDLGYEIAELSSGKHLPHDPLKIRQRIPLRGGINILATHVN